MEAEKSAMASTTSNSRRVSFHPTVRGIKILTIYDFTPREIYASWHSDDDLTHIAEQAKQVLLAKAACKSPNEAKMYCIRGLEAHSRIGSKIKKQNRNDSREAVFKEQDRQWEENDEIDDRQAIADAYHKVSSSSQMWAQGMGRLDRKAVEAYLYEDDEEEEVSVELTVISTSTHNKLDSPDGRIRRMVGKTMGPFQPSARAA